MRGLVCLFLKKLTELLGFAHRFHAVIGNAQKNEGLSPTHYAQANPTVIERRALDKIKGIAIGVNDIIQEAHGQTNCFTKPRPVKVFAFAIAADELDQIDGTQIAGITRTKRLLAAGIGSLDVFGTANWLTLRI